MESLLSIFRMHCDHDPRFRSADSLVREFLPSGPRGLSGPRSEGRFMGSLTSRTALWDHELRSSASHP
jgi:hypothetical protein